MGSKTRNQEKGSTYPHQMQQESRMSLICNSIHYLQPIKFSCPSIKFMCTRRLFHLSATKKILICFNLQPI